MVRWILQVSVAVGVVLSGGLSIAWGHEHGFVEHIGFETATLAPMAYTQFCLRYPGECRTRKIFRGGPIRLSADRRGELARVNAAVNASIVPEPNLQGLAGEVWLIGPDRGDCNDYAVTKRHELMARGWPARALLLSEVVTTWGEHHLVLVVRTSEGDLVLDSLTGRIKPWLRAPYRWVRMQMPGVARLWTTINSRAA
ncbi:transglutaminase-like cysteine peptidase [Bradyrhizobium sp.]|jgi:predicted transglutaminase-like cysteine proteinase|uniref:transglutaminase-like cysteine peptidase n=1 Tax=Bradyrhizobium sp. TaxID=376 RepID=UPI003C218389